MRVSVIIGLQAGEDEVEFFVFYGGGKSSRRVRRIQADEGVVFQVDGAVRALGQSFAQHLLGPRGTGGDYHDFPAVLFFLTQRLFQGEGVGLIDFVRHVFANPGAGFVQLEGRILLRHLFHADKNFHAVTWGSKQLSINDHGTQQAAISQCPRRRLIADC